MKVKLGIVGYGRMGRALAGRLVGKFDLYACDIREDLIYEQGVNKVDTKTLFSVCRYIVLCLNKVDIQEVVLQYKSYCNKTTYLINVATESHIDQLNNLVRDCPYIQPIGVKIMGQYIAIEHGMQSVIVTESKDERLFQVVSDVFSTIALVIKYKEDIVGKLNHWITKKAIRMLCSVYEECKKFGIKSEVYELAAKSILIGTIEEFKIPSGNEYIEKIMNEIRGEECNEG